MPHLEAKLPDSNPDITAAFCCCQHPIGVHIAVRPPASRYSPDMSKHAYLGTDPSLQADNLAFAKYL